ncbi:MULTISPECIES: isochorismatase family protein [unclassified Streptomyces]|uniref:isochorismatase family protein n=1 Tax=unclassified Streptomyces TaxID=2593676 RepID=UPI000DB9DF70|nr:MULTISPECIES: isochorismatase family protein [unclassified Streptomyces]MYT73124.1 isochorismatase family protein [Streptomyces sp. SID8367]RAJ73585.1 nicotinamidase-related amidase [Streptomyces sp. PsTaAH-137]
MSHAPALLVIDMQNALLPIMHRPAATVAAIAGLRTRALAADVPVVTLQHHGTGLEPGTEGWRIVPELDPAPGEPLVAKTTADAFLGTDLDTVLGSLGITEILITGFATENCVETTARQALSRGYDLVLVADGHTTSVRPAVSDFVPADRSIAHHNEIYRHIDFPDRRVRVLPAAGVDFGPAA